MFNTRGGTTIVILSNYNSPIHEDLHLQCCRQTAAREQTATLESWSRKVTTRDGHFELNVQKRRTSQAPNHDWPQPPPASKNSPDLHQSQERSLAKVGWTCPPRGDALGVVRRRTALQCNAMHMENSSAKAETAAPYRAVRRRDALYRAGSGVKEPIL